MEKNHPKKEKTILDSLSPKSNKRNFIFRQQRKLMNSMRPEH